MRILLIYFEIFLWFVIVTFEYPQISSDRNNDPGGSIRLQHRDYNRCDPIIDELSGAQTTLSSPHEEGARDVSNIGITVVT